MAHRRGGPRCHKTFRRQIGSLSRFPLEMARRAERWRLVRCALTDGQFDRFAYPVQRFNQSSYR